MELDHGDEGEISDGEGDTTGKQDTTGEQDAAAISPEQRVPSSEIQLISPPSDEEENEGIPRSDSSVIDRVKKLQMMHRSPTLMKRPRCFTDANMYV